MEVFLDFALDNTHRIKLITEEQGFFISGIAKGRSRRGSIALSRGKEPSTV